MISNIRLIIYIRHIASNEQAWNATRQYPGITLNKDFGNVLVWGTASTKYTTTHFHIDDQGFGTMVTVTSGGKYWVVGRQADSTVSFGSSKVFDYWSATEVDGRFELEGVLLELGSVL